MSHQDRRCSHTIYVRSAEAPRSADRATLAQWPRRKIDLREHVVVAHTPAGAVDVRTRRQLEDIEREHGRIEVSVRGNGSDTRAVAATTRSSKLAVAGSRVRTQLNVIGQTPDAKKVRSIAQAARSAGGRALIVGGAVRDAVARQQGIAVPSSKDIDVEVFGIEEPQLVQMLQRIGSVDETGKSFAVFKIKGSDIDVSIPRSETKTSAGHRGFDVHPDPSMTVERAAERRDFTMNAMSFDPLTGELLDPTGGASDLAARKLRVVSDAFDEDPLRVLRGAQFIARFGLSADADTIERCRTLLPEAQWLPSERVWTEWEKLFKRGIAPGDGVEFLAQCGWLEQTPGFSGFSDVAGLQRRLNDWAAGTHLTGDDRITAGLGVLYTHSPATAAQLSIVKQHGTAINKLGDVRQQAVEISDTIGSDQQRDFDSHVRHVAERMNGVRIWCDVARADSPACASAVMERAQELGCDAQRLPRLITGDDLKEALAAQPVLAAALKKDGRRFGRALNAAHQAHLDGTAVDHAEALRIAIRSAQAGDLPR